MRYELAHDSLARQILDRVSGEAKARRQAKLLVARAHKRYLERKVLLTQEDLDELRPHEAAISFSAEEMQFITASKRALSRAARRKRQITIGIISILSLFLLFALWQWQRSLAGKKALQAKSAYEAGRVSQAFRLATSARNTPGVDGDTRETSREVLQDIYQSGLLRDLIHPAKVKALDVNPAEEYILSISQSPVAYIWDLQGKLRYQLEHPTEVRSGGFIPWEDDRQAMTVAGNTAYFWDGQGKLRKEYALSSPIEGFDFNEQYQLSLIWNAHEVVLLDDSGTPWPFELPQDDLMHVTFSPNDNDLLLVSRDSVSSWWLEFIKLKQPKPRFVIRAEVRWADYVAADQVQLQTLIQFSDSTTRVFDAQGALDTSSYYQYLNRELQRLPTIQRFDFSPPGFNHPKTLLQTDSSSVRYWSAYRKQLGGERVGIIDFYTRYDEAVWSTSFSPGEKYLLTASADGRVDIWNIGEEVIERYKRFRAQIRTSRFIRDDRFLITSALDDKIQIWQVSAADDKSADDIVEFYDDRLE
jgi:WD40 repeat protein